MYGNLLRLTRLPTRKRWSNVANPSTKAQSAFVPCSMSVRAIKPDKMKKALLLECFFRVWCIPLAVYCQARRRNFPQIKGGTIVSYYTPSSKQVRESAIRRTTRRITQDTATGGIRTQAGISPNANILAACRLQASLTRSARQMRTHNPSAFRLEWVRPTGHQTR